jgi:endonuclease YncB( thermonuclease family)
MLPRTFTAGLLWLFLNSASAEALTGTVVAITDGDTLVLLVDRQQNKVRIAGIDAPEKVQAFGSRSQSNLGQMAFQKQATADCPKRDRYGRLICKVFVDGQDVGLRQITDGMAWWFQKYGKEQSPEDRAAYEQAETMAKIRRVGLWTDTNPTPPWDWRHIRR